MSRKLNELKENCFLTLKASRLRIQVNEMLLNTLLNSQGYKILTYNET